MHLPENASRAHRAPSLWDCVQTSVEGMVRKSNFNPHLELRDASFLAVGDLLRVDQRGVAMLGPAPASSCPAAAPTNLPNPCAHWLLRHLFSEV